jgi:hypothetical protein
VNYSRYSCVFAILHTIWKGKKRHLPLRLRLNQIRNFCFSIACIKASTLEVCVPDDIRVPLFAKTIVFDFVFLQILEANIKS